MCQNKCMLLRRLEKNALSGKGHKEGTNMGRLMFRLSRHSYQ